MGANVFQPGEMCGGCEIVGLLGSGGFAQVYEVIDPTGARRALKVLDTDAEARPKLRARLAQEGAALTMIEHVNVVRLYDAGFHEDRIYLVLELIRGKSLREAMRAEGGGPPPETLVRWLRQACDGVGEAHRMGVFHRDLKPENILVAPHDLVKVIDFGIAKFTSWGVKTTHEQRLGTALYMSPEHIQGRTPDARMDVYALGLVLYEMLAGEHPIVSGPATPIEICARQLNFRPPPLASVAPEVPPELGAIVDRAIEKDPSLRPPSMRALSDALQDGLRHLTVARQAAVNRVLTGPRAGQAPTRTETSSATSWRGFGATSPLAPVVVRPPDNLASTAPIGEASPDAVTAPIDTGALGTAVTVDAITVPVRRVSGPRTEEDARARPGAARRPGLRLIAMVVVAAEIGVGGGVWLTTRVLEGRSAPTAVDAAVATGTATTSAMKSATPRTANEIGTATELGTATATGTTAATARVQPAARVKPTAPRAPGPKAAATVAPKPRTFPDYDGPL